MEWKIKYRRHVWHFREIVDSFDLWWIQFWRLNEDPKKLLNQNLVKFKDFDSVYFWVNFCYDQKRPKNMVRKKGLIDFFNPWPIG